MDEFPVALRGEGVDLTQTGSKSDPEVTFSVPANTGAEARELKIFVGGADCGKSVVQQSKYTDVAVGQTTWARGNVVLEGGQFAIGAPTDYGLYFKFNSTYGMPYDPGAAYYQGTAYNPNPVTIGWKDMAADAGGDPCRLVAPADTWRLPTRSEIEALNGTAGDSLTLNGVLGQSYAGGALFVPTAGILYDNTGAGLAEYRGQGEFGYIWSSTRIYSMCFEEEVCEVYPVGENYALSVRCVKNVNYAFYVSHTPSTVQTSDAFDLTVTCKSDLAEFPVQVRGGDVDMTVDASKTSPTARFSIPANETDADRELKIYVNGIYTGKSVRQAKKRAENRRLCNGPRVTSCLRTVSSRSVIRPIWGCCSNSGACTAFRPMVRSTVGRLTCLPKRRSHGKTFRIMRAIRAPWWLRPVRGVCRPRPSMSS